jgi:hypothetical protein
MAYGDNEIMLYAFLSSALDWGERTILRSGPFIFLLDCRRRSENKSLLVPHIQPGRPCEEKYSYSYQEPKLDSAAIKMHNNIKMMECWRRENTAFNMLA